MTEPLPMKLSEGIRKGCTMVKQSSYYRGRDHSNQTEACTLGTYVVGVYGVTATFAMSCDYFLPITKRVDDLAIEKDIYINFLNNHHTREEIADMLEARGL